MGRSALGGGVAEQISVWVRKASSGARRESLSPRKYALSRKILETYTFLNSEITDSEPQDMESRM